MESLRKPAIVRAMAVQVVSFRDPLIILPCPVPADPDPDNYQPGVFSEGDFAVSA